MSFFKIAYFLSALAVVLGGLLEIESLTIVFKPLLMPFLGLFFFHSVNPNYNSTKLILLALCFAFFGDVALMFSSDYFILGILFFLITHVFYALVFMKEIDQKLIDLNPSQIFVILLFLVLYVLLMMLLWTSLNDLKVPVCLYGLVLILMGVLSYFRKQKKGYYTVFFGACLFIVSDSILAINHFLYESSILWAQALVILFYVLAQYLIVCGLVKNNVR